MAAAWARQRALLPRLGVSAGLWKLADPPGDRYDRLQAGRRHRDAAAAAYGMEIVWASTSWNTSERRAMLKRTDLLPSDIPG